MQILSLMTVLSMLILIGCGDRNIYPGYRCIVEEIDGGVNFTCEGETETIKDGETGTDGKDGKDGHNATLIIHNLPTRGACVDLGNGIWAENEGNHADIYNNSSCAHSGGSKAVICNDISEFGNENCFVERRQFLIQGTYSDILIYEIVYD